MLDSEYGTLRHWSGLFISLSFLHCSHNRPELTSSLSLFTVAHQLWTVQSSVENLFFHVGLRHGHFSELCWSVFICVYVLHSYILWVSVLWHCWLGHTTRKFVSEMTCDVSGGMLNSSVPCMLVFAVSNLTLSSGPHSKGSCLPEIQHWWSPKVVSNLWGIRFNLWVKRRNVWWS